MGEHKVWIMYGEPKLPTSDYYFLTKDEEKILTTDDKYFVIKKETDSN